MQRIPKYTVLTGVLNLFYNWIKGYVYLLESVFVRSFGWKQPSLPETLGYGEVYSNSEVSGRHSCTNSYAPRTCLQHDFKIFSTNTDETGKDPT